MLWISNLCKSLSDNSGVRYGSSFDCARHSRSNSVTCSWKFSCVLLRCISPAFFSRNSVRMVGEFMQSYFVILGISSAPPYLANMWCISPLYIIPSLPWSLRAFRSCSPMHHRYAFFSEKASRPKSS